MKTTNAHWELLLWLHSVRQVQFALTQLLQHACSALKKSALFSKNNHYCKCVLFSKPMIVHDKIMMLMQARHLVHKLIPPGWQYKQARPVCKALFNHAIYGIYEGFYQAVLDFIWVVYFTVLYVLFGVCRRGLACVRCAVNTLPALPAWRSTSSYTDRRRAASLVPNQGAAKPSALRSVLHFMVCSPSVLSWFYPPY
jgi:hypothetical protein